MGLARLVRLLASSMVATAVVVVLLACSAVALAVILFGSGVTGAIALYFVVWWVLLFVVLPFGIRSQADEGEVVPGSEPGAPARHVMIEKTIWTTLAANVVFLFAVGLMPYAGL